ncbi:response regulator transcription factor [Mesonia maritima]|uniref:DNA-binding NarL/FixJ family response regulator n=1 Tax=Mesonia maritima TaxID=1793873 RepID=A0ABU1K4W9_9FLAO|nr:response regulator transcription factor [Mesonia maritima]MDR6300659.1 DNA-binding NarL/FixJ family response regulator [Mesonia maritima]
MLKIAIADDHQLFRKSLILLVNSYEEMEVVIEASNGEELLEELKITEVDIVLIDLQMPIMDGFATIPEINKNYQKVKILVLTLLNDMVTIKKIMELGVQGYFTKNTNPQELKKAILKLSNDGFHFEKKLASIIENVVNASNKKPSISINFTEREMEVLILTTKEYCGTEIAQRMNISPRTVEKHKRNLMDKTDSRNFIGVIIYAFLHKQLSFNELKD